MTVTASSTVSVEPPEKLALTDLAALIVREQVVLVPLQAPPHEVNVAPALGVAVSVTLVPAVRLAEHVVPPAPQAMPPPLTGHSR